jgi:hypothetical protein
MYGRPGYATGLLPEAGGSPAPTVSLEDTNITDINRRAARREVFEDRYMILWQFYDMDHRLAMAFEVLELAGTDGETGQVLFQLADGVCSLEPVEDIDSAEVFLEGSVKWDGCSNWKFNDGDCMLHFCGYQHATSLGRMMARMYEITQAEMGAFDANCADMPKTIEGATARSQLLIA